MASISYAGWPTKEITLIVPYSPGGTTDQAARNIASEIEKKTGNVVLVKNMPGAANLVAINHVINQPNNNHTFIISDTDFISGTIAQGTNAYTHFTPTNIISFSPYLIIGSPETNLTNFKTEIKNKKIINIGNAGGGGYWLKQVKSPIEFNAIPYKGGANIMSDVMASQLEYGISSVTSFYPLVVDKKVNPIAIVNDTRIDALPDVPTAHELGFIGNNTMLWTGIFAQHNTEPEAIDKFSKLVQDAVANSSYLQSLPKKGGVILNYGPAKSQQFINKEVILYKKINSIT